MNPALLIFDMDGVLVDSEPIANRIMHKHLVAAGVPLDYETSMRRYIGRKMGYTVADVRDNFGIGLPPEFERVCREETLAAYETELQPVAGVAAAIAALPFARCVASSSDPTRIAKSLTLAGLDRFFEGRCFSATMVKHGKPAPDLFLFAAKKLGAEPAACLVIEDTLVGLEAARAAGMKSLAYAGAGHTPEEALAALATRTFRHMDELPAMVAGL
jgi:HAD superfamily hydrolase (TIGR01509 family)